MKLKLTSVAAGAVALAFAATTVVAVSGVASAYTGTPPWVGVADDLAHVKGGVIFYDAAGAVTGFLSGLLGVGGGFVLVPMLHRFTLLSVASVVGTSLMVVALVSVFGALASVAQGVGPPWVLTLWYTAALSVGMVCGRAVERRLHESLIRRSFALLVLGVAAAMALDVAWRLLAR